MQRQELIEDLSKIPEKIAARAGLGIDPYCASDLRDFIEEGVRKLENNGLLDNYQKIAEAETNLTAFVGAMVQEAKRQNETELHEFTLQAAVKSFCPLFPFC